MLQKHIAVQRRGPHRPCSIPRIRTVRLVAKEQAAAVTRHHAQIKSLDSWQKWSRSQAVRSQKVDTDGASRRRRKTLTGLWGTVSHRQTAARSQQEDGNTLIRFISLPLPVNSFAQHVRQKQAGEHPETADSRKSRIIGIVPIPASITQPQPRTATHFRSVVYRQPRFRHQEKRTTIGVIPFLNMCSIGFFPLSAPWPWHSEIRFHITFQGWLSP